jgi:hypothetical protein
MHECAGPSRDVKKPYFIGFLRVPAIGVPGAVSDGLKIRTFDGLKFPTP